MWVKLYLFLVTDPIWSHSCIQVEGYLLQFLRRCSSSEHLLKDMMNRMRLQVRDVSKYWKSLTKIWEVTRLEPGLVFSQVINLTHRLHQCYDNFRHKLHEKIKLINIYAYFTASRSLFMLWRFVYIDGRIIVPQHPFWSKSFLYHCICAALDLSPVIQICANYVLGYITHNSRNQDSCKPFGNQLPIVYLINQQTDKSKFKL